MKAKTRAKRPNKNKIAGSKTQKRASQSTSVKNSSVLGHTFNLKNVWPVERDFMERPDRWKYVRKIAKPEGCVFCAAHKESGSQASFENLVLYKSKHSMVVMNKFPYNTGHLMIIPQMHCGEITDLPMDVHLDMQRLLKETMAVLKKAYDCAGMNAGINLGAVAGAGIPEHLHWHIVPRWFGDTNFFPLIAETKALPETLAQTYVKLAPLFKDLIAKDLKG